MNSNDKKLTVDNITEKELDELLKIRNELTDAKEQMDLESQIRLAMFDAIPDLVFCKDLEGKYIECNEVFEKFMNRTYDNVLGKTYQELGVADSEQVEAAYKADQTVIREGKTVKQEEIKLSYNNNEHYFEMIKTPLVRKGVEGEPGEIFGLLGIMHDVTDRYVLVKSLREAQSHLEDALEKANSASTAKSEFLSRMSHELRTPMNAIMGMSQIAKISNDPDKIKNCVDEIYEYSHHLMRLISNLLEVSSGISNLTAAAFSLDSMIEYIESRINPLLSKKLQTLEVKIDGAVPRGMVANEKRIAQVIIHLLTNASKFSDGKDNIILAVNIAKETTDGLVLEFSVADNGIGMSEDTIHTIFDMFEQGDGSHSRQHEGIGVGLTLSKYIVEMMGGKISVESELDKGSTFTFTVPVSRLAS